MRPRASVGEGKLGCFIWLAVLLLVSLIAYKAIPIKLAASQLYDYMDDQARFSGRASSAALRDNVLKRAKQLELPVTARNITVKKSGGMIYMQCKFTAPVEVLGYTYMWDFDLVVDRQIFIF